MKNSIRISIYSGMFISIIFLFQHIAKAETASLELGQDWVKTKNTWGIPDGMWKLKDNKDIYATAMSRDLIYPKADFDESHKKEALNEMTKGRNQALGLIGIDDWHITDSKFKVEKGQVMITLQGAFHDTHATTIEFKEVHIWKKTKYQSLTINYPKTSKFGESAKSTQAMNRFISSVSEGAK